MINLKKYLYVFLGVIFGTTVIGLMSYKPVQNIQQKSLTPSITIVENNTTGIIEGSMGYPSEIIPKDVIVCAENQETSKEYCTDERIDSIKFTNRVGYRIEVPVGVYLVYEKMKNKDYRAYYNQFVTCGLSVDCTSHEPIKVYVSADEKTDEIDPIDWYNQPSPTP